MHFIIVSSLIIENKYSKNKNGDNSKIKKELLERIIGTFKSIIYSSQTIVTIIILFH